MLIKEPPDSSQDITFHTQGPLPPEASALYVPREADTKLGNLINARDYAAVIGPRCSGKSSMLLRQWDRLRQVRQHIPVYIALKKLRDLPAEDWFRELHLETIRQTNGLVAVPDAPARHALAWHRATLDMVKNGEAAGHVLVMLLDQVEATPEDVRNAFFSQVREMFVNRWLNPVLKRIVFVLAGRFMPDELIKDPAISPFRVAQRVYIQDADLESTTRLVAMLGTEQRQISSDVPARVHEWTDGDVYLTHKLCAGLARDIPRGAVLLPDVDRAAKRHLFEDDIFRTMWHNIQAEPRMAELIDQLIEHRAMVPFTLLQRHIMRAWLEGAIKEDGGGYCMLHSLVHESVFYLLQHTRSGYPRPRRIHPLHLHEEQPPLRGRYQLEHIIHPGLTCYVYRGKDLESGRTVAVKQLMVTRHLNEMAWHRFQRESSALKSLHHPNIVRLLDTFSEDGLEYIVMEYVYGGSLFERLNREGRLSLRMALDIAMKIASALSHAHSKGVIHRDVKPANVMLTPDLQPRLADFGIARLNYQQRMTLPHRVIGTPAYLSPEGFQGQTLDERGDMWSLGVVLFEMLAGALPFTGRTDDLLARAIMSDPPRDIRTIRPDVPEAVVALLDRLLAQSLDDRLPSADKARETLRDILTRL